MKKYITCPACKAEVKVIANLYSLGGHIGDCHLAGEELVDPDKYIAPSIGRTPFPYQQKGIEWGLPPERDNFALFWEMRLGKTLTAIKILQGKGVKKPLIVCPKAVIHTWLDELKLEGIENPLVINTDLARVMKPAIQKLETWYVTNYETLIREDISDCGFDAIVCDESHKLKDPKTKISSHLTSESWRKVPIKGLLTGTPAPENLLEYYQQMKFLFGDFAGCPTFWQFKHRFFKHEGNNRYVPKYGIADYLSGVLATYCNVLKREHAGIGGKTLYEQRFVSLEGDYKQLYEKYERDWISKSEEYDAQYAIAAYQHLHQLSGGFHKKEELKSDHKLKELKSLLRNDLAGEQVVIWCKYLEELETICKEISKYGRTTFIRGDVPLDVRHQRRLDFNEGHYKYLVCQIKTASQGLDMSGADTAIVYSNEFGAMYRSQLVDRLVHPHKKTPNLIIDIVCENTLCHEVYNSLMAKIDDQNAMLQKVYNKLREKYAGQSLVSR
ncbi:MAG: DEAD/DEAH box helicase [Sphingobacteriaceae bacterium]|nr:DEAD/DEAH box helicase [Sphingobacteriaceae bacterium]